MSNKQINPKFIHALTNTPLESIPTTPTFKHLGGVYVKAIVDNLKKIETQHPKNEMFMQCTHCGANAKYDIGLILIDVDDVKSRQFTGYFRCKRCNAGGPWTESVDLQMLVMSAVLAPNMNFPVHFGAMALADGFRPAFATDAEEHYLTLIQNDPENALLWNKLGNLLKAGSRPELAMAAYEKSLALDADQLESHLSIANLLHEIRNYKQAVHHFHQMLIVAEKYPHLTNMNLRELLSYGLSNCMLAVYESKYKFNFLPSKEQLLAAGRTVDLQANHPSRYATLSSEDLSTFYPLAEAFMGDRLKKQVPPKPSAPRTGTKAQQVEAFIANQTQSFTKADIQQACPDISLSTITKVVRELRKTGKLEMTGMGANTRWFTV